MSLRVNDPVARQRRASPRRPRCVSWLAVFTLGLAILLSQAADADAMLRAAQSRGPQAVVAVQALQTLLARLDAQDEQAKLVAVNDFFNRRIVFANNHDVWSDADHWASPLESLAMGRGDCKGYVIGKYFSLMLAGVPMAKLRLVYVRAELGGHGGESLAHMVLAYYAAPGAEPLILDNLLGEIRGATRRPDLSPVFSFNGEGLWRGVGAQGLGDPAARLSRWREVLAKAHAEGFQ